MRQSEDFYVYYYIYPYPETLLPMYRYDHNFTIHKTGRKRIGTNSITGQPSSSNYTSIADQTSYIHFKRIALPQYQTVFGIGAFTKD